MPASPGVIRRAQALAQMQQMQHQQPAAAPTPQVSHIKIGIKYCIITGVNVTAANMVHSEAPIFDDVRIFRVVFGE